MPNNMVLHSLDVIRYEVHKHISQREIDLGSPEIILDRTADELVAGIVVRAATQIDRNKRLGSREIIASERVPVTWWDHFKQRWFPDWALSRWPAETRVIDIMVSENYVVESIHRLCPHLNKPDQSHFDFMMKDDPPGYVDDVLNPERVWRRQAEERMRLRGLGL